MLRLALLGRPQVWLNDQPVVGFVSEKALALLGYLAVRGATSVRDSLAGLLWGEMPQDRARANLRMALYNLQKLLPGYLTITRLDVAFNRAAGYWLDVEALEAGDFELDLYQGDFLEGLYLAGASEFEGWVLAERERLRQLMLRRLTELAGQQLGQADYAGAIQTLRRSLALDAWQESVHLQLMEALARNRDYTAAISQYELCRRILADDLGLEPMPETTGLYERLKTLRSLPRRIQLPLQPTPFIGRQPELAQLGRLFSDPAQRLVSISGPGGIGKTRLALEAAARYAQAFLEGVFFVPLAALETAADLPTAILAALEVPIQERADSRQQLIAYLRHKEMLLVLDNFEHLTAGAPFLSEIVIEAPHIHLLVTTRARLNLRWETLLVLEGLAYPQAEAAEALESYSAIHLCLQSAQRIQPNFKLAAGNQRQLIRLCQVTEGLPLALELASAWVAELPLAEIVTALQGNLDLLSTSLRDVPERHRSLRAAIDTSWQLLTPAERAVFCRLSVFRGGFNQEAARRVAQAKPEILAALGAKSLLRRGETGRYDTHEMLRQYAAEKLAEAPAGRVQAQDQHSAYYTEFLSRQTEAITGMRLVESIQAIRLELDNLRAAWNWAIERRQTKSLALGLKALAQFYRLTSLLQEGESAFSKAVHRLQVSLAAGESLPEAELLLLGELLVEQAHFQMALARHAPALEALQAASELATELKALPLEAAIHLLRAEVLERQGEYAAAGARYAHGLELARAAQQPALEAGALIGLGVITGERGEVSGAEAHFQAARHISRSLGDRRAEYVALHNLAIAAVFQNEQAKARAFLEQQLGIVQEIGSRRSEAMTLLGLSLVAAHFGQFAELKTHSERALLICREIGDRREEGTALGYLGLAALATGAFGEAKSGLEGALRITQEVGHRIGESEVQLYLGLLYRQIGDYRRAQTELENSLANYRAIDLRRDECLLLAQLSVLFNLLDDPLAAQRCGQQALKLAQELGDRSLQGHAWTAIAAVQAGLGQTAEAALAYQQGLELRRAVGQDYLAIENLAGLARLALAQDRLTEARSFVAEILPYLRHQPPAGVNEPGQVYLTCYQVLHASRDERARTILTAAYDWLQAGAAQIPDPDQRQVFLEQIASHSAIRQAYRSQL